MRDAISEMDLQTCFGHTKFDSQGMKSERSVMLTQIIDGDCVLIGLQDWAEGERVIVKPEIRGPALQASRRPSPRGL